MCPYHRGGEEKVDASAKTERKGERALFQLVESLEKEGEKKRESRSLSMADRGGKKKGGRKEVSLASITREKRMKL